MSFLKSLLNTLNQNRFIWDRQIIKATKTSPIIQIKVGFKKYNLKKSVSYCKKTIILKSSLDNNYYNPTQSEDNNLKDSKISPALIKLIPTPNKQKQTEKQVFKIQTYYLH